MVTIHTCRTLLLAVSSLVLVQCGSSSGGQVDGATGSSGRAGSGGATGGASGTTGMDGSASAPLYYTRGGVVYRMVPGAGNDVSMASDFDDTATALVTQ